MIETPPVEIIAAAQLVARVAELKIQGWRLVQICATTLPDVIEVSYSFDRDGCLLNLRLSVTREGGELPSVSAVFWCAFLYENEMHDLFGICFPGLALDFKGHLYKTAIPRAFAPPVEVPSANVIAPSVSADSARSSANPPDA